ncbi:CD97 antigen-like [Anneissia japonica]|uniref:CD97 antigen-like n=1 Tax=Anneissia japonica TaxID=1529436 RepID=UPI001425730F|nr:CD97 antigen-like [Anneissia japonica]
MKITGWKCTIVLCCAAAFNSVSAHTTISTTSGNIQWPTTEAHTTISTTSGDTQRPTTEVKDTGTQRPTTKALTTTSMTSGDTKRPTTEGLTTISTTSGDTQRPTTEALTTTSTTSGDTKRPTTEALTTISTTSGYTKWPTTEVLTTISTTSGHTQRPTTEALTTISTTSGDTQRPTTEDLTTMSTTSVDTQRQTTEALTTITTSFVDTQRPTTEAKNTHNNFYFVALTTISTTSGDTQRPTTEAHTTISTTSADTQKPKKDEGQVTFEEVETPEVSNVRLTTSESDSVVTFTASAAANLANDGPFSIVASLIVLKENAPLETANGEVLPSVSDVVDINIYDKNQNKISTDSEIQFPSIKNTTSENVTNGNLIPVCHHTPNFTQDTPVVWSTDGCKTVYDDYRVSGLTCKCSHLTSFVILMKEEPLDEPPGILSMITIVGIAISSFFLIITLITILGFRGLRSSDRYRILCHLVIALLCVNFLFFLLQFHGKNTIDMERSSPKITCSLLAGCLHYCFLVAFSWMLIMSTDLYMKVILPFADHEKRFVYSRYIGWIGPAIVVVTTAGITRENYASDKCWLDSESGAIWAFIAPVCLTLLIVLVQLVNTGLVAFEKSKVMNHEETQNFQRIRTLFVGMLLLTPAVGLTWIFGVIIVFSDSEVMEYIFVFVNSLQGFFIWLSQCVFSQEVRLTLMKRFKNRIEQDTSTTNTNRDTIEVLQA